MKFPNRLKKIQSSEEVNSIQQMYVDADESHRLGRFKIKSATPLSLEGQMALSDLEFAVSCYPNQIEATAYIRELAQTLAQHTLEGKKND